MRKSKYSDSQIIAVLKQAEAGTPVPELCREHNISSGTFYNVAIQIRRYGCVYGDQDERAGRREPASEEDVR